MPYFAERLLNPIINNISPALLIKKDFISRWYTSPFLISLIAALPIINETTRIGSIKRNTHRQPRYSAINPPKTGPNTGAKLTTSPTIPSSVPRW